MNPFVRQEADHDFSRARGREIFQKILNLLNPDRHELLSLQDVRETLHPRSESYRGLQVVPIGRIVGSEGRYRDFNKQFLPRHEHLRRRWTRVDEAHLLQVTLPSISLYEIGGIYFVRDGNHRVSVAKSQGAESIDAEVITLDSEIRLDPGVTRDGLRRAVIDYEKRNFYRRTRFDKLFPAYDLEFTATGRYDEALRHIYDHKYYINMNYHEEIPFERAMVSWFNNVFRPTIDAIRERRLLGKFPGRTEADLYMWTVKHWHELKSRHGGDFPLSDAAEDYKVRFGRGIPRRLLDAFKRLLEERRRRRAIARGEIVE